MTNVTSAPHDWIPSEPPHGHAHGGGGGHDSGIREHRSPVLERALDDLVILRAAREELQMAWRVLGGLFVLECHPSEANRDAMNSLRLAARECLRRAENLLTSDQASLPTDRSHRSLMAVTRALGTLCDDRADWVGNQRPLAHKILATTYAVTSTSRRDLGR